METPSQIGRTLTPFYGLQSPFSRYCNPNTNIQLLVHMHSIFLVGSALLSASQVRVKIDAYERGCKMLFVCTSMYFITVYVYFSNIVGSEICKAWKVESTLGSLYVLDT